MNNIKNTADLKAAIQHLEDRQRNELSLLKEQFLTTYESLKPLNVIKNTFHEFTSGPAFKDNLLGASVGVTTGLISKALIIGSSKNPLKQLFGTLLQFGVSNIISRNPETIKNIAGGIINLLSKKKETNPENIHGSSH